MASVMKGNWGFFGNRNLPLPEFGITEMFGGKQDSTYSYNTPRSTSNNDRGSVQGDQPSTNFTGGRAPTISNVTYSSGGNSNSNSNTKSNTNSGQSETEKRAREQEKKVRNAISDRAGRFKSNIDNLRSLLPQYETQDTSFVDSNFGNSLSALQVARDQGLNKLNVARDNVNQMSTNSIRDLEQDIRNRMMATNMQLGAMGAGDSSASQIMAPYAFSKLGSNVRADVLGQRNSQLNDVQLKESDLITTFETERSTIETEKNNALNQIRLFYRDQLGQLNQAKANADDMEMEAIQNMETGLLDRALNELGAVQDYVRNRQAELESWTRNRLAQLNDSRLSMANNANFEPRAIVRGEIPGLSQDADVTAGDPLGNLGFRFNRREDQQSMFS